MERALIIDDDQLVTNAMLRALHPYYAEIKAVSSGTEALREMGAGAYDLCFFDISLAGKHGLYLLKSIQELSPGTKIVIMTGSSVDDEMMKELEECSFCFLEKPFDISELKAVARRALQKTEGASYGSSRRWNRIPLGKTIDYSITVLELGKPTSLSLKGDIVDVSDSGVVITTHYPLEPGHLVVFTSGLEHGEHRTGIVKSSKAGDDGNLHHVEIEFIDA